MSRAQYGESARPRVCCTAAQAESKYRMNKTNESILTPGDWVIVRRILVVYGALLSVITIAVLFSGRSLAVVFFSGLLFMWFVALGLGFFYLVRLRLAKRPWYWPFVLNAPLLFVFYIASALALSVFAATFTNVGGHRPAPAQFLIDLSNFMKAWWWVLLTICYAILGLASEAINVCYGPPAAIRGLRWLMAGQIIYLVALGGATLLAQQAAG